MTLETIIALNLAAFGAGGLGGFLLKFYKAKENDKRIDFNTLLKSLKVENENLKKEIYEIRKESAALQKITLQLERQLMERDIRLEKLENEIIKLRKENTFYQKKLNQ